MNSKRTNLSSTIETIGAKVCWVSRTRLGKRQKYIEEFKNGKLNVLINDDGLTT